jgi:predicted DNA-binding transcriptional regulator YafY
MDKVERLYHLDRLLAGRRTALPLAAIMAELQCSESSARRTIDALREHYQAPLIYDRPAQGWRYDTRHGEHPVQLPGLWFSDTELHALLSAHEILGAIPPGLLRNDLAPLTARIHAILARRGLAPDQLARRIRLIPIGARPLSPRGFGVIATALLQRRRLRIHYRARTSPHSGTREVSPERLTWYRNNWYLDAWCHQADGYRRFACECITDPQALATPAEDCGEAELDAYFAGAYGIFAGPAPHTAVLRFSPARARWVADEQWHPDQQGQRLPDGHYELRLPYGTATELLMDILRHGPEVQILSPPELIDAARDRLARTLAQYD